jgi:uncharacterized protein
MNKLYELRESKLHGGGVFAAENIKKGQIIFRYEGDLYYDDDLKEDEFYSGIDDRYIQVGEVMFLGPYKENKERNLIESPDDLTNHSCNPNCLITNDKDLELKLIARRDIKKGEELTLDYSTVIFDSWKMECHCGEKNCRKIIREFRTLPIELQKQYIKEKGVPKYFLKHIKFEDESIKSQ